MSKVIRCPRARVWQALVSPGELIRWDTRRVSLDEPIPDYPAPGLRAHWRCAVGGVTLPHVEEPVEVVPGKRLRSSVHLGSFGFEETYTLSDEEPDSTRLSLRLATKNKLPLLGGELDRFDVRRLTVERVDDTLHWLQAWCEAEQAGEAGAQRAAGERSQKTASVSSVVRREEPDSPRSPVRNRR